MRRLLLTCCLSFLSSGLSFVAFAEYYGDRTEEIELVKRWYSLFDMFDRDKDDVMTKTEHHFQTCVDGIQDVGKTISDAEKYCKKWFKYYEKHILRGKSKLTLSAFLDELVRLEEDSRLNDYFEDAMTSKVDAMDLNSDGYITHPDEWDLNDFGFPLDGFHIVVTDELIDAYVKFYTNYNFKLRV